MNVCQQLIVGMKHYQKLKKKAGSQNVSMELGRITAQSVRRTNMFIIVEGPDGAGKSTLIDQLLKSYPGSVFMHFGKPETDEDAFNYWKVYAEAIESAKPERVTILDRSWYSDLVYGPIFRGRCEMDLAHVKLLESYVLTHGGGMVIYCTAPLRTLWSRCCKRGETYVTSKELLAKVSEAYDGVMGGICELPVVRFDTNAKYY